MRSVLMLSGLALALMACSPTTYYSRPGATMAQIQADSRTCLTKLPNLSMAAPNLEYLRWPVSTTHVMRGADLTNSRDRVDYQAILHHRCMIEAGYVFAR